MRGLKLPPPSFYSSHVKCPSPAPRIASLMAANAESDRLLVQPDSPDDVEATTMTSKAGTSKKAGLLTWKEIGERAFYPTPRENY